MTAEVCDDRAVGEMRLHTYVESENAGMGSCMNVCFTYTEVGMYMCTCVHTCLCICDVSIRTIKPVYIRTLEAVIKAIST